MAKVSKEDIYSALMEKFKWTPDEIARLNPVQQLVALRGPKFQTFSTLEDYQLAFGKSIQSKSK